MSILHISQIGKRVKDLFLSHIPKDDLRPSDPDLEAKILTRCLAALGVQAVAACTEVDAGSSVIDGGDDDGIDAVYYSPQKILTIVQSKWIKDGRSEPDSAAISKFCNGVRDLVRSEFERFNPRLQKRQSVIDNALQTFGCRVVLVLIHTGVSKLAVHGQRIIDDLLAELNDTEELATFQNLHQEEVYRILTQGLSGTQIDLEFGLANWGRIDYPNIAYYGTLTGEEVASWWEEYGERLFDRNLRGVLGDTEVNRQIHATIEQRPEDFWYFNNGITVIANNVEKTLAGGSNRELGNFKAHSAYIVNGAQTVSTIGRFGGGIGGLQKVRIPVRVISLQNAAEGYGALITRSNNTQNRIEPRDFVSHDPEQLRIKSELILEGVEYHLSRSENFKAGPSSFDLEEATIALACASADGELAVIAKREIGRFFADIEKTPYKAIFNPTVHGLAVFHSVLVQRIIDEKIKLLISQLPRRSGQRYGTLVHGNRLISAVVFAKSRVRSSLGNASLNINDHKAHVEDHVDYTVNTLTDLVEQLHKDNFLANVFKNPTKSKNLFDQCLGAIGDERPGI